MQRSPGDVTVDTQRARPAPLDPHNSIHHVQETTMRIRQLALVARELEPVVDDLCAVLSVEVAFRDPGVSNFGLSNALLALGDTFLEVVSPTQAGTTAGRLLEKRGGDGGYMVIAQVDGEDLNLEVERKRLAALDVRVVWETKLEDVATLHLHPRDVGAAILSLDVAVPPASWRWAGPAWTGAADAAQADSPCAITGAVLQSSEPSALARRWSQVLDRPVVEHEGVASVIVDDVTLQFSRATDGRGDGLAGLSIRVADRGAALATARKRNLPVEGDAVAIAGVQLRLL